MLKYSGIIYEDAINGINLRTTIFFSGCDHNPKCINCHSPELWDFNIGYDFTDDIKNKLIDSISINPMIKGITILGGEPLSDIILPEVCDFLLYYKKHPKINKTQYDNIWLYTGYTYEDLLLRNNIYINKILHNIDVLVDGPFIQDLKELSLKFRGSSNQRIIDMKKTIRRKKVVLI